MPISIYNERVTKENIMEAEYHITRREDWERINKNIRAKLDSLYKTNRTLAEQNSKEALEAIFENHAEMKILEDRLKERLDPKKWKVI
jgi:hypothetical protein